MLLNFHLSERISLPLLTFTDKGSDGAGKQKDSLESIISSAGGGCVVNGGTKSFYL